MENSGFAIVAKIEVSKRPPAYWAGDIRTSDAYQLLQTSRVEVMFVPRAGEFCVSYNRLFCFEFVKADPALSSHDEIVNLYCK